MGKLYLHIGTPKTGTSMIQYFMNKNRNILEEKGYSYPDFGFRFDGIAKNRNGHFLTHKYYLENKKRDYEKEKELQEKGMELLRQQLDRYPAVILSDEQIWNGFEAIDHFWEKLYETITSWGHELKVIVYLRRQDKFVQSYWAQQVKEVSQISFQKYLQEKRYKKCHLHYKEALDTISKVVGKEHMMVRVYEKEQYQGAKKSLISDFLVGIGIDLTEEFDDDTPVVNGSLDGACVEVKRICNHFEEFRQKKNFLVPILRKISTEETLHPDYERAAAFREGQRQSYMEEFACENQETAAEYLKREDGILFYEPLPKNEGKAEEYTKEELVLTCGKIMLKQQEEMEQLKSELKELKKSGIVKRILRKIYGKWKRILNRKP